MRLLTTKTTRARKALLSLVVLALLAVVLQSIVFSGASFTSQSRNPGLAFTAGTLTHTNSKDGQVVVSAPTLMPGQSASGTLTVTGGPDFSALYTLTKASVVDTPATPGVSNAFTLQVDTVPAGPSPLFLGTIAAFNTVDLATLNPGAAQQFRITIAYPTAASNPALQGATVALTLRVTGVTQ